MSSSYSGPERRHHRILITRNTEYHLRDNECVGVRNRDGEWVRHHDAVGERLEGTIGFSNAAGYAVNTSGKAIPGHRLCFGNLLTSPLSGIERPRKEDTDAYCAA